MFSLVQLSRFTKPTNVKTNTIQSRLSSSSVDPSNNADDGKAARYRTTFMHPSEKLGKEVDQETRKKRIVYHSKERGMHENDLLLGSFTDQHLNTLTAPQLAEYETLLQELDPDIFGWITNTKPCPPELDGELMEMLRRHVRSNPLGYAKKQ